MKRILVTIIALICVVGTLFGCEEKHASEPVIINLYQKGITNERLKEMIESGEIPANVTELYLNDNEISDITPLTLLTNLEILGLNDNEISNITSIASLANLTELQLGDNEISDITPLASLTNLTSLWLVNNKISDVTPLASLANLTYLDMRHNRINDITPLVSLTNLFMLELGYNEISDITSLASLTNLTRLFLYENSIPQEQIIELEKALPTCIITAIEPVRIDLYEKGITNKQLKEMIESGEIPGDVSEMNLYGNEISDVTPLASLTNLSVLFLGGNPISQKQVDELQKALPNCTIR